VFTWKWGEGPVEILTRDGLLPGILSYGCIHTNAATSVVEHARNHALNWERTYIFTGKSARELAELGVRPGLRVVLARSRRIVTEFGDFIGSYFLDDRADLAVWLLALEALQSNPIADAGDVTFLASASEEVGGEGAQFYLGRNPTDICVALEIGPKTPEADFPIDEQPTIWVRDGYAAMEAIDGELLEGCCARLGQKPHWQYLSRGGSDASCSAARGLIARAVTLGFPTENSHGYEIMHRDAPAELSRLLLKYLQTIYL
jgi:putative aminopeptidase FrvX